MCALLFYRTAPEGSRSQLRGRQGRRQPRIPYPIDFCPLCSDAQKQPACRSHRAIGEQPGPQLRRFTAQGLQQCFGTAQALRGQRRAQDPIQNAGGDHQHRPAAGRLPKTVAAVPQGGELRRPVSEAEPDRQQRARRGVAGRCPEYHRQHGVGRRGGNQQDPGVHIGVKHAADHRHASSRQQTQTQHTAGHSAGNGEEQQRQPEQAALAAVGNQAQQHPCRQLYRRCAEPGQPRQEHRRRISAPGQAPQQIAPPPQGKSRQPGRRQKQQIVHSPVKEEYAVDVNDCHDPPPLVRGPL